MRKSFWARKDDIPSWFLQNLICQIRQSRGHIDAKKFADQFSYKDRLNRSSYAKVMVVLRTDSEIEDKTGTIHKKLAAAARV